jgi:hypothetical protein
MRLHLWQINIRQVSNLLKNKNQITNKNPQGIEGFFVLFLNNLIFKKIDRLFDALHKNR